MSGATRAYDVVALRVPVVVDAKGTHDPHGTIFAPARHEPALRAARADAPHPLVRPLVLRACVGERVVVHFRNELDHRAGIHPQGVSYDVARADGGVVGANPDSAAEPGGIRRYTWDCAREGVFFLGDLADLRGSADGSQAHGLCGALVVEPAGATWTDQETGEPLQDGPHADVHVPGEPSFREYVTFLRDRTPVGGAQVDYRHVPRRTGADRYSSWRHGDPVTPLLRAYPGDRALLRLVHAGTDQTHAFHLHGHRWPEAEPVTDAAPLVDTVAIGPQQGVTIAPVGGAGGGAAGDWLWLSDGRAGLWGIWRVFGTVQDGSGRYPDGSRIGALRPLPGHHPPHRRSLAVPDGPRPAPPTAPVRRYDVLALSCPITYHGGVHAEHRDDAAAVLVPADDVAAAGGPDAFRAAVASGARAVHPLAIRAARGEVVELSVTDALDDGPAPALHAHRLPGSAGDAGLAVGWNAEGAAADASRVTYRWYCDEEGTVPLYCPDDARRRHGLYGCIVVEPDGARWTDPHDPGREVGNAEQAVVTLPDGSSFREQVLAVADTAPLARHPRAGGARDAEPAERPTVAVGYRCEPLCERPGDPAEWFSSTVHGDPGTPLPRAYPGEAVRLRVYQPTVDARHGLVLHGLRWAGSGGRRRNHVPLGPGEAYDLHIDPPSSPGDHLWSLGAHDDTRLGGWGLLRVHDGPQPDLPPLPGGPAPGTVPPDPVAAAPDPAGPVRRFHVRVRGTADGAPSGRRCSVDGVDVDGPPVLRARAGEWVELTLSNDLPGPPPPDVDAGPGSDRVSLQAAGLRYDVRDSDGAFVGRNPDTTVKPGQSVTYRWYADAPGPVLLGDRADARSHWRGTAGVLVVEPEDATPCAPDGGPGWAGEQAVVCRPGAAPERELVLLLSDGPEPGQAAVNRRSARLRPGRPSLTDPHPPTPQAACAPGERLMLHIAVAADRPAEHTFVVHGHGRTIGGLGPGGVRSVALTAGEPGDYAYRSGSFRWLTDGMWGLIRVRRR